MASARILDMTYVSFGIWEFVKNMIVRVCFVVKWRVSDEHESSWALRIEFVRNICSNCTYIEFLTLTLHMYISWRMCALTACICMRVRDVMYMVMDMRVLDVSHIARDEYVLLQHVHFCGYSGWGCVGGGGGCHDLLHCAALCCRVLQGVAGRCSVVQWVAVCDSFSSVLQHVAGRCNVLPCGAATWAAVKEAIQCVAVWCSVLKCVAVWCSVFKCVAVPYSSTRTTSMEVSRY